MRRALIIAALAVFVVGGLVAALGAGDGATGKEYKIVFDNAFGVVPGADFKVGGVAVGSIKDLDVERSDARAIVSVTVSKGGKGFGGLRKSTSCTINPQSLIGEYFVDCQPGKTGPLLKSGATVPVKQTTSPIPPDLVVNVLRMPVAERFSIILGELGAGFAARGNDLNETVRRALPALQSTDEVLKVLARNRRTLADLSRNSGTVLKVLGERHADVGRFVVQADKAATATAARRQAVSETFRRFPGFLDQLTPTMRDLGTASRQFTPAVSDLRVAAPSVTGLLNTLRPFSRAALPAVTSLGDASKAGRTASREAQSLIRRLGILGEAAPEPAKNLRFILDHLDDRRFAVDRDTDSPTGAGYTGLEAPLQYVFDQSLAVNVFDQRGYTLKLGLTTGQCSDYTTATDAKANPAKYAACNENLGPNQPGITTPDPSPPATRSAPTKAKAKAKTRKGAAPKTPAAAPTPGAAPPTSAPAPTPTPKPLLGLSPVQKLIDQLPKLIDPLTGKLKQGLDQTNLPPGAKGAGPASSQDLLDFLLSP